MVGADEKKFQFWLFHLAKNGLFFYRNQVSQALYLREFLKTYNDKSNLFKTRGTIEFTQAEKMV